jgi:phage-related tail fiber protein
MSNTIRIKRRASGASGAPSSLENAELAFNEVDDVLYYGKGTGGAGGTATTVLAIAGPGQYVDRSSNQTIGGTKTFSNTIVGSIDGNAGTATKLATARTLAVSGDATGSASFDGSANATIAATLATVNSNVGTFTKLTVNGKGLVTAAANATLNDIGTATADYSVGGYKLTNLAAPLNGTDAANKDYVDSIAQGLDPKQSVRAASTANIASLSGTTTIDGVALSVGDRVLVKDQTTASQNGIYVVAASTWSRSADANVYDELISAYVFVESGTTNADNGFLCTVDPGGTLGTTAITWVQFSGAGQIIAGAGLTKTGNQIDVAAGTGITVAADNVALAGQALALHNLATNGLFTRTGAGTVAARSIATSGTGISASNGDGVAGNPTLSLSAALSTVGGLTPAADRIAYYTGASSASLATLTSFGRSLIDDADAAAGRTTLGLGTMATQNANSVAITGGSIQNLSTFTGITIDGGTF